ncbi:MAG: hypothetical protein PVJ67_01075 [Candidatus Pacearchaeota archaeon]|jgi:bifunctional DNA-binding transcriptional regulator/antitoxin component of YhaV-PrlF toxin-antitoxin module
MEKIVSFDKHGRIYIPEKLRRKFAHKTIVISATSSGICLQPVKEDPILALGELGEGKMKKSIQKLKKEAREEIEKDAKKKLRRH